MKLHHLLQIFAAAALVASCAPLNVAAPPVATLTLPAHANIKKLEEGRAIYASACVHCHGPARIDKHGSDEKWAKKILPGMCIKSKLNAEQTDALTAYVMTARKALAEKPANQ